MEELTNLEICKRIAEIEGILNPSCDSADIYANVGDDDLPIWEKYNPLTDDALCFQLMVKYNVIMYKDSGIYVYNVISPKWTEGESDSPNKAICLAIIEANK